MWVLSLIPIWQCLWRRGDIPEYAYITRYCEDLWKTKTYLTGWHFSSYIIQLGRQDTLLFQIWIIIVKPMLGMHCILFYRLNLKSKIVFFYVFSNNKICVLIWIIEIENNCFFFRSPAMALAIVFDTQAHRSVYAHDADAATMSLQALIELNKKTGYEIK